MHVDEVILRDIEFPLATPFRARAGHLHVRRTILVEVLGDDVRGVAELPALPDPTYMPDTLRSSRDVLVRDLLPLVFAAGDVDAAAFDSVAARVRGHAMAKAALSLAIADGDASRDGVSLAERWGGTRTHVPAGVVAGEHDSVEELLGFVTRALEEGYVRVKLKIRPGWDVAPLRAVRDRFPALDLAADANGAYALDDGPGPWAALDHLDLAYVEEPLAPGSWVDLLALGERMETPVCLDESLDGVETAKLAIHLGAASVFNVKIPRVGGVGPALAIHDAAREAGIDAWVGGMLDGCVGRFHQLSLASLPGFTLTGDVGGSDRYSPVDLLSPPIRIEPGRGLAVPPEAGVAARLDPDRVAAITLRSERYRPPS